MNKDLIRGYLVIKKKKKKKKRTERKSLTEQNRSPSVKENDQPDLTSIYLVKKTSNRETIIFIESSLRELECHSTLVL